MSASYEAAQELLAVLAVNGADLTNDEELVVLANARTYAALAIAEEVEALVELLRERLPVPGDDGVARIVCAAHPGFPHTITLGVDEPRVYRPAGCTCAVARHDVRAYPAADEWREGCPAHPTRPDATIPNALDLVDDAECTACGVRLSLHGVNVPSDHPWIRS